MEIHQLRYLVAIARTGSFSKAAAECHVAQPSLSQQIAKLEEELGEPLCNRSARGAVLTAAGEALVRRAERILREVEEAQIEARDASKLLRGRVSIGAIPTIAPYLLPEVLTRFARENPGVEVVIHEDTTAQLVHKLVQTEIDIGLASLPLNDSRLEVRTLFTEPLLLALPLDHPLARKRTVRLADLADERFILMQEGHCLGAQALNICQQARLEPNVVLRSAQIETTHALVAAGFGISLVPAMACAVRRDELAIFRCLADPQPERSIVVCFRKGAYLSRAALRLLEFLQTCRSGR